MINGIFVQRNERQWRGQRKAVEDYLNGCRGKLVGEFTEVESGKRAVAGTCMGNRRATVPFSEVKDAVEGARLKAIWRCLPREHLTLSRGTTLAGNAVLRRPTDGA